jgi:hypothetical protein
MRVPNQNRRKNMSLMSSLIFHSSMRERSAKSIPVATNKAQKHISKIG